jgi:hypothetical protein
MFREIAVFVALMALAATAACDDRRQVGCRVDSDCRGARACVAGSCELPGDGDASPEPDADPDPGRGDAGPDTITPDPIPRPTSCEAARELLSSCDFVAEDPEAFGIDWDACNEFDQCAAQCTLELGCGDLACDWSSEIVCIQAPWSDCMREQCEDPPEYPCDTDTDCVRWDRCCGEWECSPTEFIEPSICQCAYPGPHPGCGCVDGLCRTAPTPDTICGEAINHFEHTCNHAVEDLRDRPEDHALLVGLRDDACTPERACYAACLRHDDGDFCSRCHFSEEIDCDADPFADCVSACKGPENAEQQVLCQRTGGRWGAEPCENCCGPPSCGGDPSQQADCTAECCGQPQCYCPTGAPFWEADRGCVSASRCSQ